MNEASRGLPRAMVSATLGVVGILIAALVVVAAPFAEAQCVVTEVDQVMTVAPCTRILEVDSTKIGRELETLAEKLFALPPQPRALNRGMGAKSYWVGLELHNPTGKDLRLRLFPGRWSVRAVTLYQVENEGDVKLLEWGGRAWSPGSSTYQLGPTSTEVLLSAHKTTRFMVFHEPHYSANLNYYVAHPTWFYKYATFYYLCLFGLFGICLTLIFYALFLFTMNRDVSFLHFSVFGLITMIHFAVHFGPLDSLTFAYFGYYADFSSFTGGMIAVVSLLFAQSFLEIPWRSGFGRANILFSVTLTLLSILTLSSLRSIFLPTQALVISISVFVNLVVIGSRLKTHYYAARMFFLGWLILGVATIALHLQNLLSFVASPYLGFIFPLATIALITFMAFSLSDRINALRASYVSRLEEQERELESKVQEKTAALNELNHKLAMEIEQRRVVEAKIIEQQASLLQRAKDASLGQIAGAMAHEINNPLAIIRGRLQQIEGLQEELPSEHRSSFSRALLSVDNAALRIQAIIKGLMIYSHTHESHSRGDCAIYEVIEATRAMLPDHNSRLEIQSMPSDLWLVEGQLGKVVDILYQVIMFFFVATKDLADPSLVLYVDSIKQYVEIRLVAKGMRLSSEESSRLFDPFYTTEQYAIGEGLGLSVVKGAIEAIGGQILCDPNCDETCIVLRLIKKPRLTLLAS